MNVTQSGEFKPIPNPYIVGNPIEGRRMFFGRVDDFEFIRKKVSGTGKGGIIVLCGSRRSGKTSILFQIKDKRLGEEFLPVLIDMQSITVQTDRDFLEILAIEIASALNESDVLITEDFHHRLDANPLLAFNEFTSIVSELLAGKNLILMFDEYELFESQVDRKRFSKDVLNLLAYWMENSEGIFFLFTGSDRLEMRDPKYWESFLGKALHRRISFLRRGDTMRLVHEPIDGLVEYADGVPEEIFQLTAGQPFYTQVLCQSLVDHLNEFGKNYVTHEDIDSVVEEIIENPLPQMIFSWSSMSQMERICLSIIGELSRQGNKSVDTDSVVEFSRVERIGYILDPNKTHETLERLFHMDYLEKDPKLEIYTFRMDLWKRWVIRMHSVWQTLDEIASEEGGLEEGIKRTGKSRNFLTLGLSAAAILIVAVLVYDRFIPDQGMRNGAVAPVDSSLLTVNTQPVLADVFLDRTFIGRAPVIATVPAGISILRVSSSGYNEYVESIRLEKDVPFKRMITLSDLTGRLEVESNPPGAVITLNGSKTAFSTPAYFDSLSVNYIYTIGLALDRCYTKEFSGIWVTTDSTTIVSHDFRRIVHPLTVISVPPGALVSIDGVEQGVAPVSIRSIEEGTHELIAEMKDYYSKRMDIEVPVRDNQISFVLDPLPPGILIVEILPYAELWINGELQEHDAVNFRIELRPGEHNIELRHPVYGVVQESVKVLSGKKVVKTYNLETRNR